MPDRQKKRYYDEYTRKMSIHFHRKIEYIETVYNFDLGMEFEVAICEVLRSFLPTKFGICRGFAVDEDNKKEGDDIIIYDQQRFPTMRFLEKGDFTRKESIPVEAIYAYIEAKHTLNIDNDHEDNCVFQKATKQCTSVKKLISQRESTFSGELDPYLRGRLDAEPPRGYPTKRNPPVGIIISRHVAEKGKITSEPDEIAKLLKVAISKLKKDKNSPDLVVCGQSDIIVPTVTIDEIRGSVPFYNPDLHTAYGHICIQNNSFGHFLTTLAFVLDYVKLGRMPWIKMLNNPFV